MRAVNRPQSWWGWHGWNQPEPMSVPQIIRAGTMPSRLAAAFWIGMERGASFIFAADPPGAGKTTILTALLAFARPETVAYFTRGWGETFDLPPLSDDYPTYLLVNEMSDHLPVYSWGPYVIRSFELLAEGYSLCTTVHADTVDEVVEQLELEVGVPRAHLAHLTFIVPIAVTHCDGRILRRILEVGVPIAGQGGFEMHRVACWDERTDTFRVLDQAEDREALSGKLGLDAETFEQELEQREELLRRLTEEGTASEEDFHSAIQAYRRTG